MNILNRFINYWYDCINSEDIFGKDISIYSRTRAVLYPFDHDPFIFIHNSESIDVTENEKLINFAEYTFTKRYEVYYGYPILFYYDDRNKKYRIAPLFIIKMKFIQNKEKINLEKDESIPTCGIQALSKLGLKTEEIADLSQKIETSFHSLTNISPKNMALKCLAFINEEVELNLKEEIIPGNLTNNNTIKRNMLPGIYNKSILFSGENTIFNLSLLQDLAELKNKNDLAETALAYLLKYNTNKSKEVSEDIIPILPFPTNEYQLKAMIKIFKNPLSVITGPPGTGKSQFISNLLVNFYLRNKTALFVSHTNEAVGVVNQKINEQFNNLIFRTGKKVFRQELLSQFSELITDSGKGRGNSIRRSEIERVWKTIIEYRNEILEIYNLMEKYENNMETYRNISELYCFDLRKLELFFLDEKCKIEKSRGFLEELKRLEQKHFYFSEKIIYSILPFLLPFKLEAIKRELNDILIYLEISNYLRTTIDKGSKENRKANNRKRLERFLRLYHYFIENKQIKKQLNNKKNRMELEKKVKDLESEYYEKSKKYIRKFYLDAISENEKSTGAVNSFLHEVGNARINEDINLFHIDHALNLLKIWSSTLKSLRRTFPLKKTIFDYVIFDEASQIDLPSAAPALYRAKKAIVVGDPKQLTHIAGITKKMDREIAGFHGLLEEYEYYPSKIRYCDISLYFSAESTIQYTPIFLNNHYRSEDEIIGLCNSTFYNERLKIMTMLDYSRFPNNLPIGVHWNDCRGEVFKHPAGSRINQKEVKYVIEIYKEILEKIKETDLTLGIVTPYRRQCDAISDTVRSITNLDELEKHQIEILTAHRFQGSEKDIMIFSLVLASEGNGNSDRWYNIYPQILNVALSRAKYLLYIVGDKDFCISHLCDRGEDCILKKLIKNYEIIKKQEDYEKYVFGGKFDSPSEQFLFKYLQEIDFSKYGYRLIPKFVFKRYTLDFALIKNDNEMIDIECDGRQHQVIEGLPILEDVERDSFLQNNRWRVLRFPNHQIFSSPIKVVDEIVKSLTIK